MPFTFQFHKSLLLFLVGLPVFYLNFSFIINHFYISGAYLLDSGFLADLIYRNEFNPRVAPILGGHVFNGVHFSIIHNIMNIISYIIPFNFIDYYAFFQGIIYALLSVSVFSIFLNGYDLDDRFTLLMAICASIIFAFTGVVLNCVFYPHFEAMTTGFAILFFLFLFKGKHSTASLFFVLCLFVREDSGLHLVALLLFVFVVNLFSTNKLGSQNKIIMYTIAAFTYSFLAILIQKFYFKGGGAFSTAYMGGSDNLSYITIDHVISRLVLYYNGLPFLWQPLLILIVWAVLERNFYLLIGFFAQVPWFFLHILSTGPVSEMSTYRVFPFIVAMAWPFIIVVTFKKFRLNRSDSRVVTAIALILFFSSFAKFVEVRNGSMHFLDNFLPREYSKSSYDKLRQAFSQTQFGSDILVDQSVASLEPRAFEHRQVLDNEKSGQKIDYFFHWIHNHFQEDKVLNTLSANNLSIHYIIRDTHVLVSTQSNLETDPKFKDMVIRLNPTP